MMTTIPTPPEEELEGWERVEELFAVRPYECSRDAHDAPVDDQPVAAAGAPPSP
jgi:hypothetical protein